MNKYVRVFKIDLSQCLEDMETEASRLLCCYLTQYINGVVSLGSQNVFYFPHYPQGVPMLLGLFKDHLI